MKTPETMAGLQLLEDLLPHCREHGGALFSCEVLSISIATAEEQAVAAFFERKAAGRRAGVKAA